MRRFSGVYPVLYAFHDADGRLDHEAMRLQVEHCLAAGAHGVTVLGLVTEVHKMTTAERHEVVEVVGAALAGRVPYAVTIAEKASAEQIAFARKAKAAGADWVILQPPPGKGLSDPELQRHFGAIADALDLPVSVQNNPVNLDSALSPQGLADLVRAHENITLLKAEGWSVDIASVIAALDGKVDAFGGHGGIELISLIRSGGAGLIPAPDCVALQVAIVEALMSGDPDLAAEAEAAHLAVLPLIVFMTRTLPGLLCYGKRLMAKRLGLELVHEKLPAIAPTPFGLAEMERLYADAVRAERYWLPKLTKRPLPA